MRYRKPILFIHRWLGLISGLAVFIISITGCIYAFEKEIRSVLESHYREVKPQQNTMLPPSSIQAIAGQTYSPHHIHSIGYSGEDKSVEVIYYNPSPLQYEALYINPYTGEVLKHKDFTRDFFWLVLQGHYYLWLPPEIGKPLVATSTLLFAVMIIFGLFLWWPKHHNALKQRIWFRWKPASTWKRKNYDLHNILGFYACFIAFIFVITGLVWGFEWFSKGYYVILGGEKSLSYQEPNSKKIPRIPSNSPLDSLWSKLTSEYPENTFLDFHLPHDSVSSIFVLANPDQSTHWKSDYLYFDQYSLKPVQPEHVWDEFKNASNADKMMRMNYDIHVGAILGLPGKALAFLISLLCASLPVTGILLWHGRKYKN